MSTVIATSLLPDSTANDTLTIGGTGDSIVMPGNLLTMNSLQDAGGNAIVTSDGSGVVTSSALPGAMRFIKTVTASNSASVSFTTDIDSTYDVYRFVFISINPATDAVKFTFQASTDGGSSYGVNTTSTYFQAYSKEEDTTTGFGYLTAEDVADATSYIPLGNTWGNASDECGSGEILLYAPSDTTYMKHYQANVQGYDGSSGGENYAQHNRVAGYFNTTTAINAINFKMSSGNFDGAISMYGFQKS